MSDGTYDTDQVIRDYKAAVLNVGPDATMDERRAATATMGEWATDPGVTGEPIELGGVPGVRYGSGRAATAIVYAHGGGYVMGSLASHGRLMGHLCARTGADVYGVDFRRAPEHPFPAALDDTIAALRAVRGRAEPPRNVVLAGDSAGGGLVLATLGILRDAGEEMPAAGVLLSPWIDLALTGESLTTLAEGDPFTALPTLELFAGMYAAGAPVEDWRISPLYMDFSGLPPLLFHVSASEILFDDARGGAERATAAGVDVTLRSWPGVPHVFQLFAGQIPEAEQSFTAIAEWLDTRLVVPDRVGT